MSHRGRVWIAEHRDELAKQYPGEWVAADGNGSVFHNEDLDALAEEVMKNESNIFKYALDKMQAPETPEAQQQPAQEPTSN